MCFQYFYQEHVYIRIPEHSMPDLRECWNLFINCKVTQKILQIIPLKKLRSFISYKVPETSNPAHICLFCAERPVSEAKSFTGIIFQYLPFIRLTNCIYIPILPALGKEKLVWSNCIIRLIYLLVFMGLWKVIKIFLFIIWCNSIPNCFIKITVTLRSPFHIVRYIYYHVILQILT